MRIEGCHCGYSEQRIPRRQAICFAVSESFAKARKTSCFNRPTMSSRANKSSTGARAALIKQRHRPAPDGGSKSLPTSKRLWQNDDELIALETFALASDRKAAIDALKKDGQSSIQSDIFGGDESSL